MPADSLSQLQAQVTKTATFQGAALDLKTKTPRRGLFARVMYTAASTSSGTGSVTFSIDASDDNSTFNTIAQGDPIALSTTAAAGEQFIHMESDHRYYRLSVAAISGTGATITYQGDVVQSRP
jgi:hypothetical protein